MSDQSLTLTIDGTEGIGYYLPQTVTVISKTLSIFIQTDKAMYKPSQLGVDVLLSVVFGVLRVRDIF